MKRIHIKLEPINIDKLIKQMGDKKAAESIGISAPAIKKYIKDGKAPKATEMAAESVLAMQSLKTSNENSVIIKAEQNVLDVIKKVVETNNGSYFKLNL